MKYLFTLLFAFNFNVVYTQKYQPLVEEGKYWIYNHYNTIECFQMGQRSTEIRYFSGDTIIQGQSYKKLVSSFVPINVLPYNITSKQSLCYMREDTLQRKVFLLNIDENVFPCADGAEACIWDFSLKIGDTLPNCLISIFNPVDFGEDKKYVVDSVKLMINNFNLNLNHFYYYGIPLGICGDKVLSPVKFVEGFGMEDGPIYKRFGSYLHNYCEGTLGQCNIISSTEDGQDIRSEKIEIYPNPASSFIKVETPIDISSLEIIDQNGKIVLMSHNQEINVSNLQSGIYFVRCKSKGNESYNGKFVKI